jgi:hypothetical protein
MQRLGLSPLSKKNKIMVESVNSTLVSQIDYSGIGPPNHGFICCQPLQEAKKERSTRGRRPKQRK